MKTRAPAPITFDRARSDVSPLIDISFLLLAFFLVTSTLQQRETELALVLPVGADAPDSSVPDEPARIDLAADGAISYGGSPIESAGSGRHLPTLTDALIRYRELASFSQQEALVLLAADDGAQQHRLVDVMNALAAARLTEIVLEGFAP